MGKSEFKNLVKSINSRERHELKRTKAYYKLGKYLKKGYDDSALSNYTKRAAKRTYKFFKGINLEPIPSPRELAKMNEEEFRQQKRKFRTEITEQSSVMERIVLRSTAPSPSYTSNSPSITIVPDFHNSPLHCLECFMRHQDDASYETDEYLNAPVLSQPLPVLHEDLQQDLSHETHDQQIDNVHHVSDVDDVNDVHHVHHVDDVNDVHRRSPPLIVVSDTPPTPIDLPPYSPTNAWLFEPVIGIDSD